MKQLLKRLVHTAEPVPEAEAGYHLYELLWSLPRTYGGMTRATLQRCGQFRQYGVGDTLTILTLQVGLNVGWATRHVRSCWQLPADVQVRNVWEDLRSASDDTLLALTGEPTEGLGPATQRDGPVRERRFCRLFEDAKGRVVRTEHTRADGSLLVLVGLDDDRDAVVLYDSAGAPVRRWPSVDAFYLAWLDWAISRRPAVLINEHRLISQFLYRADMPGVRICQVIHGSHHKGRDSPFGELNSRAKMMQNLAGFDLVAVLTDWQRQDMLALGVDADNLRIIPNTTEPMQRQEPAPSLPRAALNGVVVGRMTPGKQIDHAMEAVAQLGDEANVTLDIFGDGAQRQKLEDLAGRLDAADKITFHGHVPGISEKLRNYSFLLLTSKAEGQPLVILEAMSHGCIPICYDMRYGPRDIITEGVDGFLVPPNDKAAAAATIRKWIQLPDAEREAMRAAAVARAQRYFPERNMLRWRAALDDLMNQSARQRTAYDQCKATARSVEVKGGSCRVRGDLHGTAHDVGLPARMVIATRKKASFVKVHADLHRTSPATAEFTASFLLSHLPLRTTDILDFYMQPAGALWDAKIRLKYGLKGESVAADGAKAYKTKHGNLSLDAR